MRKLGIALGIAAAALLIPNQAHAWDGTKTGKIIAIDTTNGTEYAFRVYMDIGSMCGTAESWAYMNVSWDNYQATAAPLTSAWMAGKPVTIYTNRKGAYCEIGYVQFR